MYEPTNLDPRDQEIFTAADEWWATRFQGRGVYDKIGPFQSQLEAIKGVMQFFREEEQHYPPPDTIAFRPFALYAASSQHGGAHVVVGTVYRDGVRRSTYQEVRAKFEEERANARGKPVRSRNRKRTTEISILKIGDQ